MRIRRSRTLGRSRRDAPEAAPAVAVVLLDHHVLHPGAREPLLEFALAKVERDRRDQVIEHNRALLARKLRQLAAHAALLGELAGAVRGTYVYSGGVSSLEDLAALAQLRLVNLAGVIVGKALYERRFTVAEGQAALEQH